MELRLWNTRPEKQAQILQVALDQLSDELSSGLPFDPPKLAPFTSYSLPVIQILPLDWSLEPLDQYDAWLFVSQNAAEAWFEKIRSNTEQSVTTCPKTVVTIGQATADCVMQYGVGVDFVCPSPFSSETLANSPLFWQRPFEQLLIIGGEAGREEILQTVRQKGRGADKIACYRRNKLAIPAQSMIEFATKNKINALLLTSQDILQAVVANLQATPIHWQAFYVIAISERVAIAAKQAGFQHIRVANDASQAALLNAIKELARSFS